MGQVYPDGQFKQNFDFDLGAKKPSGQGLHDSIPLTPNFELNFPLKFRSCLT